MIFQFLHDCVDDLIGKTTRNFNNYNSDIEWTVDDYNFSKNALQNLYRQFVISGSGECDLSDSKISENLKNEIKTCYDIRKEEIFQVLAEEAVVNRGHNLVKNFDWRLKWIMGTSSLATLREPVLQIDLHCKTNDKSKENETVNFEVNAHQLENVITELSEVQKELQE